MSTTSATTTRMLLPARHLPVFRAIMRRSWPSLLLWSAVMLVAVALLLPLFPTLTTPAALAAINRLPDGVFRTLRFDQIHTGPGYTQALIFSLVGWVVIITAGIQWGSAAIAGVQEDGTWVSVHQRGVGRVQYCLEASAAVLVRLSIVALVTYWTIRLMNKPWGLGLKVRLLGQITIVWLGLGALVAATAILVGAYTGRRLWAIVVGVAVAASSYTVDAVSRLNPHWHWAADLSPVDWAFGDNPLWKGLDGWGEVSLWVLSLTLVVCGAWVFQWRGMTSTVGEGDDTVICEGDRA